MTDIKLNVGTGIYYDSEADEVGLVIGPTEIRIARGEIAKVIFTDVLEQLDKTGWLGHELVSCDTPKTRKAYHIGKD